MPGLNGGCHPGVATPAVHKGNDSWHRSSQPKWQAGVGSIRANSYLALRTLGVALVQLQWWLAGLRGNR